MSTSAVYTNITRFNQLAATPTVKAGETSKVLLYAKGDKRLYYRDDTGLERKVTDDAIAGGLTTLQQGFDNGTGVISTTPTKPLEFTGVGSDQVVKITNGGIEKVTIDAQGRLVAADGYFNDSLVTNTLLPKAAGTVDIGQNLNRFGNVYCRNVQTTNVNW